RAAAIAEMVLWIGYLQWHFRTRGQVMPPQPVLKDFRNIEQRDAVLAYDSVEYVCDEHGALDSRWDGKTMKKHPVTGADVPDETARVPLERYVNPRKADWPQADFVVGNPPFIGGWRLRQTQGDGYVEALWGAYPEVPPKADFVMSWWDHAAEQTRAGKMRRFGLITTNSIAQVFQRRVVERHLSADPPLSIAYAVPDHPWVDTADGADVRIAMTVAEQGEGDGILAVVTAEEVGADGANDVSLNRRRGRIHANLALGANAAMVVALRANAGLCSPGVQLYGAGFIVDADEAEELRAVTDAVTAHRIIRQYANGRDFMQTSRGAFVIDFYGYDRDAARAAHPAAFQRLLDRVKPERDSNRRQSIREKWWRFGWERPVWREAVAGLARFVSTPETSKHRVFAFVDGATLPDNMLTNIAVADGCQFGILLSRIHIVWALALGGRLGVGNDPRYTKTRCFETFPFPDPSPEQTERIRSLAEQIDAYRKRQLAAHPGLTLTGLYNVIEKLRSGEALTAKERVIHEQGLASVLKELHDELDAAVFAAYGWSDLAARLVGRPGATTPLADKPGAQAEAEEELLTRLVALNAERAAEEKRGRVRWLRPDLQKPAAARAPEQAELETGTGDAAVEVAAAQKRAWPTELPDQVRTVAQVLAEARQPMTADELAACFTGRGPWKKRLPQVLATLEAVGRLRKTDAGAYSTA
ncbi:MAG: class I SAM-dependent DNA methyltransferase, partial [Burkholderiales bacterium]|nr:class I SAM-dependent DNA methyltransferase [Burkholderiales bacterium]